MIEVENSVSSGVLTSPANEKHTSRSAHVVEEIRRRFLTEEWEQHKDLYEETDIERMRNSEWFIKRYLIACNRNADKAYEMMKTALAWRKSVEISTTPITVFPAEFFLIGGLFQYECDRKGNPVIYMRIRMHRKIPELWEPVQQFLFYIINKVDIEANGNGAVILFDCSGAGYANMDIDMLRSLINVAFNYFPYCIKYVIVYELSWMLNAFRRIAMSIVPAALASIVHFANKNEITNYIALENLPDFMGGTSERDYRYVPEGCPPVEQVALERGFTLNDVKRIRVIFKPYLDEAEAAVNARLKKLKEKQQQMTAIERQKNISTEVTSCLSSNNAEDQEEKIDATDRPAAIVRANLDNLDQYASLYPQNVLVFRRRNPAIDLFSATERIEKERPAWTATILLRNNHRSKPLAFKVQCTKSDQYFVTPNQGVILMGAFVCITVSATKKSASEDKFMLLLCPDVSLERDLTDLRQFSKLFIERAGQVYNHKFKTKWVDETKKHQLDNDLPRGDAQRSAVKLEKEVALIKRKYSVLRRGQAWLYLTIFVQLAFIVLLASLLLTPNNQRLEWSNLIGGLINSVSGTKISNQTLQTNVTRQSG